jgi:hypothetical protein
MIIMMTNLKKRSSSHVERFSKTLITHSWCRITENDGSRDPLSCSKVHTDDQDVVAFGGAITEKVKT